MREASFAASSVAELARACNESSRQTRGRGGRVCRLPILVLLVLLAVAVPSSGARPHSAVPTSQILFDDFDYVRFSPLLKFWQHGWKVRTGQGWPGMPAASWSAANISFVSDPANRRNRLLRMTSSTDGTPAGTSEAQVCQRRKFREGTWATRIRFGDGPTVGPDGDRIVEGFYGISPLAAPLDPDFSELDWEYLPNGGWGMTEPTLWTTSWETARLEPWLADNVTKSSAGSLAGWHTLLIQVGKGSVTYVIDGVERVTHGRRYYPEVPMSLNYTAWFIDGGLLAPGSKRIYVQDVDWAFYAADSSLSTQQVITRVRALRKKHVAFRDTVVAPKPPLESPCNL